MNRPLVPAPQARGVLQKQYAYFIYRSLDCFSHTVTGASRDGAAFDRSALLYARLLHMLLRKGAALPAFDEVLPSVEALSAMMFHACLCHREVFWPAFVLARRQCFERAGAAHSDCDEDFNALSTLFDRAVEEFSRDAPPTSLVAGDSERLDQITIQIAELAVRMRREANSASMESSAA